MLFFHGFLNFAFSENNKLLLHVFNFESQIKNFDLCLVAIRVVLLEVLVAGFQCFIKKLGNYIWDGIYFECRKG